MLGKDVQLAYEELYTEDMQAWRELGGKYKALNIVELCRPLTAINRVLEVGAGEGSILKYLDQWGFGQELHALEISGSAIELLKKRNLGSLKSVAQFDGYTIPFEDDYFDLVVLSHVLEHVEFPRRLLREIRRVSKYQVIEVPCDFTFDVDKNVDHFLSYGHINVYLPVLLRFMLRTEGYEIVNDKVSLITKEVLEFIMHANNKLSRNLFSITKLNIVLMLRNIKFFIVNKQRKELSGNAYTVLCKKNGSQLNIFSTIHELN